MANSVEEVLIVGAGVSGLSCAIHLDRAGVPFQILESSDGVGGRVRTDHLDGFTLDRGFQVFLTAYPEAERLLNYDALQLRSFLPGALVWCQGRFHKALDPWRMPIEAVSGVNSPIGTLLDKVTVGVLRSSVTKGETDTVFSRPETTTLHRLEEYGFSPRMIDRFFRPFYGGILLDPDLQASSRMFEFTFRMFALGESTIPAKGMGEIPAQMAASLPPDSIQFGHRATAVGPGFVETESVGHLRGRAVVVATESPEFARLVPGCARARSRGVNCLYFSAEAAPIQESLIALDGERRGPVNNLHVVTNVCPDAAPPGAHLISASVLGHHEGSDEKLESDVREHLEHWFGTAVNRWRHLRTYRIEHAQPDQTPPALARPQRDARLEPGFYVCGDHRENASINGAMVSGRRAAEAVLRDL